MNEKLDILDYKINLYFTKNVNLTSNLLLLPIINEEEGNNIFNLVKSKCSNNKLDNFIILTISNFSWNDDLSPYYQEDVFKNKYSCDFKGKGDIFLNKIVNDILPKVREYLFLKHNIKLSNIGIGGYSLAGLFALYSLYQVDIFSFALINSASLWFNNFIKYIKANKISKNVSNIYISLGDKEHLTKNSTLSKIKDLTLEVVNYLSSLDDPKIKICYKENEGNHFKNNDLRVADSIIYIVNELG